MMMRMRNVIALSILSAGLMTLLCCYPGTGKYRQQEPSGNFPANEPLADLQRVHTLLKKYGGSAISSEDRFVKWKDCSWFRMFEFKNHTILIFPYNWLDKNGEEKFDLYLFAGHVKDYSDLLNSFGYDYISPENRTKEEAKGALYYKNTKMALDTNSKALNEIGFDFLKLGKIREDIQNGLIKYYGGKIKRHYFGLPYDGKAGSFDRLDENNNYVALAYAIDISGSFEGNMMFSVYFDAPYGEGKLAFIHVYTRNTPLLKSYLTTPPLPVIREGEFEIPAEMIPQKTK